MVVLPYIAISGRQQVFRPFVLLTASAYVAFACARATPLCEYY